MLAADGRRERKGGAERAVQLLDGTQCVLRRTGRELARREDEERLLELEDARERHALQLEGGLAAGA